MTTIGATHVIFSIPGRLRLSLPWAQARDAGTALANALYLEDGVISASVNGRTQHLLVCYEPDETGPERLVLFVGRFCRAEDRALMPVPVPVSERRMHDDDTRGLSVRFFSAGLIIGSLAFVLRRVFSQLLAILVFSVPAFVRIAPRSVYRRAMKTSLSWRYSLRNKMVLRALDRLEGVLIDDSVLAPPESEMQNGALEDVSAFVFGLREQGITDIAFIARQYRKEVVEAAGRTGIGKIYGLTDKLVNFRDEAYLYVSSGNRADVPARGGIWLDVRRRGRVRSGADITAYLSDLSDAPQLLELARFCRDVTVRCRNMALALGALGILGAGLGVIGWSAALALYGLNMLWQPMFVNRSFALFERELDYGGIEASCGSFGQGR